MQVPGYGTPNTMGPANPGMSGWGAPTSGAQPAMQPIGAAPSGMPAQPIGGAQQKIEDRYAKQYGADWKTNPSVDPFAMESYGRSLQGIQMGVEARAQDAAWKARDPQGWQQSQDKSNAAFLSGLPPQAASIFQGWHGNGSGAAQSPNLGMGGGNGSVANPALATGYTPSPYLQQGIDALRGQYDTGLSKNLLQNTSNQVAAGGMGGSRGALMAGQAIGDANTGFANAATTMMGADYEAQRARDLQKYGVDVGANTSRYSTDQSSKLGYAGLANSKDIANMSNQTQRYGIDAQTGLGYAGLNNQMGIAQLGNDTTRQGQNLSYDLGRINADNQWGLGNQQNAISYLQTTNQNALANRGYDLQDQGQKLNYSSDQRNQDRQDLTTGASLYNMGVNGAWGPITNYTGAISPYTGQGTTTATTPTTGGGATGAIGGAASFAAFAKQMGWF
ncbi:MAG: hypothetical protein H7255_14575 [Ramlibacter sp.]|nr:hypothetical protein [Ramlibacter sp.]